MTSTVHCYNCFGFPSKDVDFFVANCMHIFCQGCQTLCWSDNVAKCSFCAKTPIKFMKMTSKMSADVKKYYLPLKIELAASQQRLQQTFMFQQKQRQHLLHGVKKKEEMFEKMKMSIIQERERKEQYRSALETFQIKYKEKCKELEESKTLSTLSNSSLLRSNSHQQSSSISINRTSNPQKIFHQSSSRSTFAPKTQPIFKNHEAKNNPDVSGKQFGNPYKTPVFPAKVTHGSSNPYVTPKIIRTMTQIPRTDRTKHSLSSNGSTSFNDTIGEIRPPSQAKSIA